MFLIPKGNPVSENIAAAKINMPEMLEKLKKNGFAGYVNFTFPTAYGILLFEGGRLISALLEKDGKKLSGFEALASLFNLILFEPGTAGVYRLSNDLVVSLHALFHGEMLYKAQELKLIDVKGLLEKVKAHRLTGSLRIYTAERSAIIFYKGGSPLGFFHDGSQDIETSASESQKIAKLPGAKVDILSTKEADELMVHDLMDMLNIPKLWESAKAKYASELEKADVEATEREKKGLNDRLSELEEDLKELGMAYLGKMGRTLVEKELNEQGGRGALTDSGKADAFLAGVEKGGKLLTSITKIREMIDLMRNEITGRVSI